MATLNDGGKSKLQLIEPRGKRFCKLKRPIPLPIVKINSGSVYKFKSNFNGFSVVISDNEEMNKIVSMGFFGKANLSRSFPMFVNQNGKTSILRKRQYENRKIWSKGLNETKKKCIVVPDSDEEIEEYFVNLKPTFEIDSSGLKENVHLALEEAFFLKYALGCLEINYDNKSLETQQCWTLFSKTDKFFVQNYIVYHYYRAKNWVVKPGIKFGGDFLLYKEGPPFFHASYVVIIDILNTQLKRIDSLTRREMDVMKLQGLNRLCETAGKELLICQVIWPDNLKQVTVEDIPKITLNEILMRRWTLSVEKQKSDDEQ